jgi:hypothetical protein
MAAKKTKKNGARAGSGQGARRRRSEIRSDLCSKEDGPVRSVGEEGRQEGRQRPQSVEKRLARKK